MCCSKAGQTLISGRVLKPHRITDPRLRKVMGLSLEKCTRQAYENVCKFVI